MGRIASLAVGGLLCGAITWGTSGWAQEPDNTGVNKRDKNNATATADQQKNNVSDRETAQQIRKAITNDKSLSSYARNVKVVVQDGAVTLRGPVRSEEEKK